jgi:hypothetical protein
VYQKDIIKLLKIIRWGSGAVPGWEKKVGSGSVTVTERTLKQQNIRDKCIRYYSTPEGFSESNSQKDGYQRIEAKIHVDSLLDGSDNLWS